MAENINEEFDWDNLSDEEWNKRLDEKIAMFNEGRGEVKLPPPSTAIMTDEYERGINYKYITEDLIRHFADAAVIRIQSGEIQLMHLVPVGAVLSRLRCLSPVLHSDLHLADVCVFRGLQGWPAAANMII